MATCKDCFHYEACSGFKPTDLDKDVWCYCKMGIPEEIPDIDQRCDSFKDSKSWTEVVRCKDCKHTRKKSKHEQFMYNENVCICTKEDIWGISKNEPVWDDWFCSYGERKNNHES